MFDRPLYLVAQRARVVSKADPIGRIWSNRVVSDSALNSGINAARKTQRPVKTIAVLAFKNTSGDPAQDYFGDGISEDVVRLRRKWTMTSSRAISCPGSASGILVKARPSATSTSISSPSR